MLGQPAPCPFSQLAGKIIKQHSSKENELYLFIGSNPVLGEV
jgi:hypothetical protein